MQIKFTKMQGTGNDFVVIDAINQSIDLSMEQIKSIADRHFGVGCDQLLLVEKSESREADFRYRIFNADGHEAEQCGNGARCFARFVVDKSLTDNRNICVETLSGLIQIHIENDDMVTVEMGVPDFDPASLPFNVEGESETYNIVVNNENYAIGAVSMGNPHAVIQVESVDDAPVENLGTLIEKHEQFPQRVNVGFMEVIDRSNIRLRVFERGAGETMACGTGACAAVAFGVRSGLLDNEVAVELKGGYITIKWLGDDNSLYMTGPTETVFEGQIIL